MRTRRAGALALIAAALSALSACASNDQARRGVAEVVTVHARLDETTASANATARDVATVESRVRVLEGQLAQSDRDLRRATADLEQVREALTSRQPTPGLAAGPLPASAPSTARSSAATGGAGERTSTAAATAKSPAAPVTRIAPPATAALPASSGESRAAADRALAMGMASFRAGEHGQAVVELGEFVARSPEHPQAAEARWWIGEAYYRQRDHAQALVEFQCVVDAYPMRDAATRALLRVAQCHQWLGDVARGRAALERVVRDHPNTDAAARARTLVAARSATSRAR